MKIGNGGKVPRVSRHGARKEAVCVADEVGNGHFHKFLRELGDLNGGAEDTPIDLKQPLDFGLLSVPKLTLVDQDDREFIIRYHWQC